MTPVSKTMFIAGLLTVLAWTGDAAARPGGGQSYSGGGSHSSSYSGGGSHSYSSGSRSSSSSSYSGGGGGSGAGNELNALILGLGGLGLIFGLARLGKRREHDRSYDTTHAPPAKRSKGSLANIRARDPDFSAVLFEDFVYALYARAHAARGDAQAMAALSPYIGEQARAALLRREPTGVKIAGVIVGKMQVVEVSIDAQVRVVVDFETNYTAELPGGPMGYYVAERWTLERALGVTSKPPTDVHSFQCPSCGGPYERGDQGRCSRCAQQVEGGRFDWCLDSVRVFDERRTPPTLTGDVAEQGTHYPSVLEPGIAARHVEFAHEDASASQGALERRVREIHGALNAAYSAGDLRPLRPHVSDSLYNFLSYWTEAYRAQGLRNVLEGVEMSRMEVVKLNRDHHYDAITVRIWARGLDYTVALADGRRVSGDARKPRAYSEYWTLIRGAKVRGAPRAAGVCPNCGASLERVNMAGNCEACGTHLTRGEFDWVLSKIEQDDSYTG